MKDLLIGAMGTLILIALLKVFTENPEVNFFFIVFVLTAMHRPIRHSIEFIKNFIDGVKQEYLRQQQEIRMTKRRRDWLKKQGYKKTEKHHET